MTRQMAAPTRWSTCLRSEPPCYVVPLALAAAVVLAACGGGADYSTPARRSTGTFNSHRHLHLRRRIAPRWRGPRQPEAPPSVTAVVGGLMSDPSASLVDLRGSERTAQPYAFHGEDVAAVSNLSGYIFAGPPGGAQATPPIGTRHGLATWRCSMPGNRLRPRHTSLAGSIRRPVRCRLLHQWRTDPRLVLHVRASRPMRQQPRAAGC